MTSMDEPAHAWLWNLLDDEPAGASLAPNAGHQGSQQPCCFLTFQMPGALSSKSLRRLRRFRDEWLQRQGLDGERLSSYVEAARQCDHGQPPENRCAALRAFAREYARRWFGALDAASGARRMLTPPLQATVELAMHHWDQQGCRLVDYLILAARVHVMAEFPDEGTLARQCAAWIEDTTAQLRPRWGGRGALWNRDDCDHRVQSEAARCRLQRYLAATPQRLRLPPSAYLAYGKRDGAANELR
ncbi:MAG: hypothetical protein U0939_23100 [Pirellulales bacterium]